jgi:hypothetical protein
VKRCGDLETSCTDVLLYFVAVPAHGVSSGFPRWWRLGLASTEVVLAAGLIVAAVTQGG